MVSKILVYKQKSSYNHRSAMKTNKQTKMIQHRRVLQKTRKNASHLDNILELETK